VDGMNGATALQRSLVEEATYLRGSILRSYSQVEFLLADISVKLDLKFPYQIKDRIKAVKRIAERPGYEVLQRRTCQGMRRAAGV
jgi:hypothetical protein